ncbi:MAG: c-type cytochrome [Balneolales bacterium]
MIHADAGPNIIRSYPVTNNGAGYNATIENILEGVDNQWFRPSDVTVAPDGSIFVSDWYDPGVGGHRMQAPHIGRVYRIAPPETPYEIEEVDYSTPTAAIQALKSPNHAIRAKAWMQINKWGADAETELTEMYNSDNQRYRARALWLLSKIEGNGEEYINTAIEDNNPDIRIAALRAARQMDINILPLLEHLVDDASPQVLREVAIALRHNESAKAPGLWAKLALQYDGEDRWYLEALGIAADKQWDSFLEAWLAVKGDEWINEKAGRDIVWRSRAGQTLPMLVDVILNDSVEEDEKMRFFRAFDFQSSSDKEQILVDLLDEGQQDQQMITFSVLQLLDHSVLDHPKVTASLDQALETVKETADFMYLVDRYQLETKNEELVNLVLSYPDSSLGANAARHMLGYGGEGYLTELLKSNNEENVKSIIQALGYLANDQSLAILESVIVDEDMNLSSKQLAVEAFGLGRGASIRDAEDRLLKMLHDGLITSALESSAENVLMESYRADIRQAAAGYLQILNNNEATEYRPVAELIQSVGDINNGRQVFENSCQFCHQVGQEGINFGPDLTEIGDKLPKQGLYDAILDPNAGINFGYEGYILTLQNGSKVTGIRNSENDDEIDLRLPGGNSNSYNKTDIASTEIMEQSLMPNMQGSISEQEIIDLVEYLSELGSDN